MQEVCVLAETGDHADELAKGLQGDVQLNP
jgi:hypothetical protein